MITQMEKQRRNFNYIMENFMVQVECGMKMEAWNPLMWRDDEHHVKQGRRKSRELLRDQYVCLIKSFKDSSLKLE